MQEIETTETTGIVRRAGAVVGTTTALVIGGAGAALATPTPPDPDALAGELANNAGTAYLDAVVDVLPVLIPFLVALWAVGFVYTKVRPKRKGGI